MNPDEIRETRERLGLTQEDAGELVGASRKTWQQWELGTRGMPRPVELLLRALQRFPELHEWLKRTVGKRL